MRWSKRKRVAIVLLIVCLAAILLRSSDDQWCTRCCALRHVERVGSIGLGDLGVPVSRSYPARQSVVCEVLVRHQGPCRWHHWRTYHGNSNFAFYGGHYVPNIIKGFDEELRALDRIRPATAEDVIVHMHGLLVGSEWDQLDELKDVLYSLMFELDLADTEEKRWAAVAVWLPEWNAYRQKYLAGPSDAASP